MPFHKKRLKSAILVDTLNAHNYGQKCFLGQFLWPSPSPGSGLAKGKEFRSIAHLGSKLWPSKENNHQISPKITLEKESRSMGPLGPELWPCKDGKHQTISSKFEPSSRTKRVPIKGFLFHPCSSPHNSGLEPQNLYTRIDKMQLLYSMDFSRQLKP